MNMILQSVKYAPPPLHSIPQAGVSQELYPPIIPLLVSITVLTILYSERQSLYNSTIFTIVLLKKKNTNLFGEC